MVHSPPYMLASASTSEPALRSIFAISTIFAGSFVGSLLLHSRQHSEECGSMFRRVKVGHACRPGADEIGVATQIRRQYRRIAVDDCLDCRFESVDGRFLLSDRIDVFRERWPTLKVVPARDGELGIREIEHRGANFGVRQPFWQPRYFRIQEARVTLPKYLERLGIA